MATVQVLVPCYNYGRYLEQSVESVLGQEGVDVDVLIIDDCSSDNTPQVCAELTRRDSRVRVIRHETNKGHIATYNEGIAQIRGDYFVLLSADDLLTPGALSRATALMEKNPNIGMTYGQPVSFLDVPPPARTSANSTSIWNGRTWIRHVCRSGKNFVVSPEAVVRADIQRRIGGYSPDLPHSADMEMWLRIAAISDIGRVNGVDQGYYRVHVLSMQRTIHAGVLFDLDGRHRAFRAAFEKEAAGFPDREELYGLARRSLAIIALQHARGLYDFPVQNDHSPDKYREFAASLWPEIIGTFRYRALVAQQRRQYRSAIRGAANRCRAELHLFAEREVVHRFDWHWARYTGIHLPQY